MIRVSHKKRFSGGGSASEKEASNSLGLYPKVVIVQSLFRDNSNSLSNNRGFIFIYIYYNNQMKQTLEAAVCNI